MKLCDGNVKICGRLQCDDLNWSHKRYMRILHAVFGVVL